MIEDSFRKWLQFELDNEYDIEDVKDALDYDDMAENLWEDFSISHRQDIIDLVRQQVKAVLKKRNA